MGTPVSRLEKLLNRAQLAGLAGAFALLGLMIWTGRAGLQAAVIGSFSVFVVSYLVGLFVTTPVKVVWEEGPGFQDTAYRFVRNAGAIGSIFLFTYSLWSGDWDRFVTWFGVVAFLFFPWLALAGLLALGSRVFDWLKRRRTKSAGPQV